MSLTLDRTQFKELLNDMDAFWIYLPQGAVGY